MKIERVDTMPDRTYGRKKSDQTLEAEAILEAMMGGEVIRVEVPEKYHLNKGEHFRNTLRLVASNQGLKITTTIQHGYLYAKLVGRTR